MIVAHSKRFDGGNTAWHAVLTPHLTPLIVVIRPEKPADATGQRSDRATPDGKGTSGSLQGSLAA
jgi:hypothetical protein